MSQRTTFVDRCLDGEAVLDDIDAYVRQWHQSAGTESLAQFLGLSDEEYAAWVQDPDTLGRLLRARRRSRKRQQRRSIVHEQE